MSKKPKRVTIEPRHRGPQQPRGGTRSGFTLTELLVVMVIIGIILAFILSASIEGVRRANEADTASLIQKLDAAMSERMEALLSISVNPNAAHYNLANIYNTSANPVIPGADRAQVIAIYDFIKSEIPDVFFPSGDTNYPLNFAAQPYPGLLDTSATGPSYSLAYARYMLPLGAGILNDQVGYTSFGSYDATNPNGTGIFGASYAAAAGIYKNLGYGPQRYDGIDNDNDGLVDNSPEGGTGNGLLANHTHKTARSEMLYAILVEGQGPLGTAFSPDDFTSRQVTDTDGDGLPEFVDAWGEPLQFYRWPIFYHSDLQRGFPNVRIGETDNWLYNGPFDDREQDPLDPNQQLVNPSWLLTGSNVPSSFKPHFNSVTTGTALANFTNLPVDPGVRISAGGRAFQHFFHTLVEPLSFLGDAPAAGTLWDRSDLTLNATSSFKDYLLRRTYFTKFLILSSGPDTVPGVGQLDFDYGTGVTGSVFGYGTPLSSQDATNLIQIENTAAAIDPKQWNSTTHLPNLDPNPPASSPKGPVANATTLYLQQNAGLDDITNHGAQSAAGSNP